MSKPIYEYLADAEGRTWTAEDSAYVRRIFREVERLAEQVIERRVEEARAIINRGARRTSGDLLPRKKPLDCVGTPGGKVGIE